MNIANRFVRRMLAKTTEHPGVLERIGFYLYSAAHNYRFDMQGNGEARLLANLTPLDLTTIVDVGANAGHWAMMARRCFDDAEIVAVEPLSSAIELLKALPVKTKQVALSDVSGTVDISHAPNRPSSHASLHSRLSLNTEAVRCITGDQLLKEVGMKHVDFLKIDVEGYEGEVLRGFSDAFHNKRIRCIQFEHSPHSLLPQYSLRYIWSLLESFGYRIGKIWPRHVEFVDLVDIRAPALGPNYFACHSSDIEVMSLACR